MKIYVDGKTYDSNKEDYFIILLSEEERSQIANMEESSIGLYGHFNNEFTVEECRVFINKAKEEFNKVSN